MFVERRGKMMLLIDTVACRGRLIGDGDDGDNIAYYVSRLTVTIRCTIIVFDTFYHIPSFTGLFIISAIHVIEDMS